MERISELLDEVGWADPTRVVNIDQRVFRWMVEATNRIQELEHKSKLLEEKLKRVPTGRIEEGRFIDPLTNE